MMGLKDIKKHYVPAIKYEMKARGFITTGKNAGVNNKTYHYPKPKFLK